MKLLLLGVPLDGEGDEDEGKKPFILLEFADDVDVSHTLLLLDDEELDKF
jgi:hypothetical protein